MRTFFLGTTLLVVGGVLVGAEPRPADQALARRGICRGAAPSQTPLQSFTIMAVWKT